jgi:hypothetical protein
MVYHRAAQKVASEARHGRCARSGRVCHILVPRSHPRLALGHVTKVWNDYLQVVLVFAGHATVRERFAARQPPFPQFAHSDRSHVVNFGCLIGPLRPFLGKIIGFGNLSSSSPLPSSRSRSHSHLWQLACVIGYKQQTAQEITGVRCLPVTKAIECSRAI